MRHDPAKIAHYGSQVVIVSNTVLASANTEATLASASTRPCGTGP